MAATGELGPIVTLGAVEEAARRCLMEPQVLGVYIDDAQHQSYGGRKRVLRPKDVVCSTGERVTKLNTPALLIQAESAGDATRTADHTYGARYSLGIHCITTGGTEASCRRTSDILAAATAACLMQRLPGQHAGPSPISDVRWELNTFDPRPAGQGSAYANCVAQLSVTVSSVMTDLRGRLPTLPPNTPDTTGPAPEPPDLTAIVELPIEVEDPQP